MTHHETYMRLALAQAEQALQEGEVPIGAALVSPCGLVTVGHNCPITHHDPSNHAEMVAIRAMAQLKKNYRLPGCTLYVTLQPCLMCSGLIEQARIKQVFYAASELKYTLDYSRFRFKLMGPILPEPAQKMLQDFFRARRA